MLKYQPLFDYRHSKFLELIEFLQKKLKLDVYLGGFSAMTGFYHQHEIIFHPFYEHLYGTDINKIPENLLKDKRWERKFSFFKNSLLPKELQMIEVESYKYKIEIPTKERCLFEMTAQGGIKFDVDDIYEYYGDFYNDIDHKKFQELLEHSTSERTNRLGLFLLEATNPEIFSKISLSKVNLNLTENRDYSFNHIQAKHIPKYNIQIEPYFYPIDLYN